MVAAGTTDATAEHDDGVISTAWGNVRLTGPEAAALNLWIEGKTYREIANELGRDYGTARRAVLSALERLQETGLAYWREMLRSFRSGSFQSNPGVVTYDQRGRPTTVRAKVLVADDMVRFIDDAFPEASADAGVS